MPAASAHVDPGRDLALRVGDRLAGALTPVQVHPGAGCLDDRVVVGHRQARARPPLHGVDARLDVEVDDDDPGFLAVDTEPDVAPERVGPPADVDRVARAQLRPLAVIDRHLPPGRGVALHGDRREVVAACDEIERVLDVGHDDRTAPPVSEFGTVAGCTSAP
jgi:hypothetical protein